MLCYSEFSFEVFEGHVALIVDLEFLVDRVALGFDEVGSVGVLELKLSDGASVGSVSNVDNLGLLATIILVLEVNNSKGGLVSGEAGSERCEVFTSFSEFSHSNFSSTFVQVHDHPSALTGADLGEVSSDISVNCDGHI